MGFSAACLETLQFLRDRDILTITDQIDPLCTEFEIVAAERGKWPGWEPDSEQPTAAYIDRVREEWRQATVVLVNSPWTRDALVRQGVSQQKIVVVPQAYESDVEPRRVDYSGQRPLRVLWLGSVILRKGIPYLREAAALLGDRVEVRVVGPIKIDAARVREAPPNMSFTGPVPRIEADRCFRWADVFVLPTLSDGFAITQLEAMAHGLPVVTTPCCGEVVSDHRDGLVVAPGDSGALASALEELAAEASLVSKMSMNCPDKVRQFSLEAYGQRLLDAVARFRS
jgi:glycosyltransferase involved in cell wall biosynthesis